MHRRVPETPTERELRYARMAHQRWAKEPDRRAATEKARAAREQKFVDEARAMHPGAGEAQITKAAESLRRAFYTDMAYKASRSRQIKRAADELATKAAEIDSELSTLDGAA